MCYCRFSVYVICTLDHGGLYLTIILLISAIAAIIAIISTLTLSAGVPSAGIANLVIILVLSAMATAPPACLPSKVPAVLFLICYG